MDGDGPLITWEVDGLVLQQSADLETWTNVEGASDRTFRPQPGGSHSFFRLRAE